MLASVVAAAEKQDAAPPAATPSPTPCVVSDDVSKILCKYGKPDSDTSTENDKPRPTIATRSLVYKTEKVRTGFLPADRLGGPPPYDKWKIIGYQDPTNNEVLSSVDVTRRMSKRELSPGPIPVPMTEQR
jgi:hypothetical protein